jgi:hypothetical protein
LGSQKGKVAQVFLADVPVFQTAPSIEKENGQFGTDPARLEDIPDDPEPVAQVDDSVAVDSVFKLEFDPESSLLNNQAIGTREAAYILR